MSLVAGTSKLGLRGKKLTAIQIDKFEGVNVLLSVTRLKKEEAREATNLMLIEDGVWDKRWGTKTLITMGSSIDGFAEYIKSDLTRELIICAGGTIYKSTNLSTTSTISGATYTAGKACYFIQMGSYLYITNGTDAIIRYDGTSLSTYTGLSAMGTVTPTRGAGLSAGSWTYYYKVTAVNAVGETAPSAEASITVDTVRDQWSVGTNKNVALSWTAVTNALKYIVYYSDTAGYEAKLAEVNTNSYTDYGTTVPNPYIAPPSADSTTGPKLGYTWISGNRIWGVDPNYPYRVWFSGAGTFIGNFNTGYGGGWIELEKGGRATTTGGKEFQGKSHIFCQTPDGLGNLWTVELLSQSVSGTSTSYIVPVPTKIIGQTGAIAPRGILLVENDMWYQNKNAVMVAGNEPNFYNLIRSNELSSRIRPYWRSLDASSISQICGFYFDAKVFLSIPTAAGAPNRTVVYDREKLQWYKDWSVGVSQFGQFTTSDSTTHVLGCTGTKIIEFSSAYADDDGVAFTWKYLSPQIPIARDWTQFGKIKRAYCRLRNTTGSINYTFLGTRRNKAYSTLATGTITQGNSDTGLGWDLMGNFLIGTTSGKPTTFTQESLIKFLKINKLLRDIQFQLQGTASTDRAVITGLMAKGFLIAAGDPTQWKLTTSN